MVETGWDDLEGRSRTLAAREVLPQVNIFLSWRDYACRMAPTLKVNRRIGIGLGCGSYRVLDAVVIVIAVNVIAVFVDEGWVSVDYGASVSGMLNFLELQVNTTSSEHLGCSSLRQNVPVCIQQARLVGLACLREQIWHFASTCYRDWSGPGFRCRNRILFEGK